MITHDILAPELWVAAQLKPGEHIADATARIVKILQNHENMFAEEAQHYYERARAAEKELEALKEHNRSKNRATT